MFYELIMHNSEQRMRGVAKRELIGRNGVKFVYLMPPTECWTGSQQIQILYGGRK